MEAILLFNCHSAAERYRMLLSLSHQHRNTHPNLPSREGVLLLFKFRFEFEFEFEFKFNLNLILILVLFLFSASFPVPKGWKLFFYSIVIPLQSGIGCYYLYLINTATPIPTFPQGKEFYSFFQVRVLWPILNPFQRKGPLFSLY